MHYARKQPELFKKKQSTILTAFVGCEIRTNKSGGVFSSS